MERRFEGKVALVTGAASGIGKATAERLGGEGAKLLLADMNLDGVAEVAGSIGDTAKAVRFDAADSAACSAIVADAVSSFGRLDVVCNIAGMQRWGHLDQMSDRDWELVLKVNLTAPFIIMREAIPHLVKTKGNIVNISSVAGMLGIAYNASYCASKHGLIGLTRTAAVEYAGVNVRANVVAPGGVKAGQAYNPLPDNVDMKLIDRLFPKMGGGEMCDPEDIAAGIAFLASDEARYVTGVVFNIDGGQFAG